MNVGRRLGRVKSTKSGDVGYFEVNTVFNGEPVELLEESTWTAGLRRTGRQARPLKTLEIVGTKCIWSSPAAATDCRFFRWQRPTNFP